MKSLTCKSHVGLFLRNKPLNDIPVNIREAEVAPRVAVGQAFVVEAQIWWRYPHPQNLLLRWTGN
jgi:hypothetical protein